MEDKFLQEEMEKVKVYFTELQQEEIMEIMKQERIEKQDVKLLDVDLTMYVKHLIQSGKSATDWQIQL